MCTINPVILFFLPPLFKVNKEFNNYSSSINSNSNKLLFMVPNRHTPP
jgi:hypothetical protein